MDLVGDKWTLLIIRDLVAGPRRFVELQRVLPGISTEQLRSRLNRMVADGMLTRKRYREVPPRVDYELTERARELMPILGELARWGFEWAWSAPREGESINLGAIFRLAPGLLDAPTGLAGTVELKVDDAATDGEVCSYLLSAADGRVRIEEQIEGHADARVIGTTSAWVKAFSPDGDRRGLELTGNEKLAAIVLDGLALSEGVEAETPASIRAA